MPSDENRILDYTTRCTKPDQGRLDLVNVTIFNTLPTDGSFISIQSEHGDNEKYRQLKYLRPKKTTFLMLKEFIRLHFYEHIHNTGSIVLLDGQGCTIKDAEKVNTSSAMRQLRLGIVHKVQILMNEQLHSITNLFMYMRWSDILGMLKNTQMNTLYYLPAFHHQHIWGG